MLEELLVVIAGFPSSLDASQFTHPAEADIFSRAAQVGEQVTRLSEACADPRAGPWLIALETEVLVPFLDGLVSVEAAILAGAPRYGPRDGTSLAAVMADTVVEWAPRLEYAGTLLTSGLSWHERLRKLQRDTVSGFRDVAAVAKACLRCEDSAWVANLTPWLAYGTGGIPELDHPQVAKDTQRCIIDTGQCLQQMRVPETIHSDAALKDMVAGNRALIRSLETPLESKAFHNAVTKIQNSVYNMLAQQVMDSATVDDFSAVLRRIVLAGSSDFCTAFLDTCETPRCGFRVGVFHSALATYFENAADVSDGTAKLALQVLRLEMAADSDQDSDPGDFNDILFGCRTLLRIHPPWPLNLYFDQHLCRVYGDIFQYLMAVRLASDRLRAGTPSQQRAKVFFNVLWQWFQLSIDAQWSDLLSMTSMARDAGAARHTRSLRELCKRLLLDSTRVREIVKSILLCALTLVNENRATEDDTIKLLVHQLLEQLAVRPELSGLLVMLEGYTGV